MKDKFILFIVGFALAILGYMVYDSAIKLQEYKTACEAKQGKVVYRQSRQRLCIKQDAIITP